MTSPEDISSPAAKQAALRKMRNEALKLAAVGFEVFPLHRIASRTPPTCGCFDATTCGSVGKHPNVNAWPAVKTSDPKQVRALWFDFPLSGIAVATGRGSNLWVFDVDAKNGGLETLAELERKHGALPPTVVANTGGGGKHFYFTYPGPEYRNTAHKMGQGLDSRGDGGFVVAPPSPHLSGTDYSWRVAPGEVAIAPAPAWLLALSKTELPPRPLTAAEPPEGGWPAVAPDEGRARLTAFLNHPLVQWGSENPGDVSQGLWWCFARNFATLANDCPELTAEVEEAFQEFSDGHPSYSEAQTRKMFERCIHERGPVSFTVMVQQGAPPNLVDLNDGQNLVAFARRAAGYTAPRPSSPRASAPEPAAAPPPEEAPNSEASAGEVPKRGPGRPRKEVEPEDPNVPKRGPGRPRKEVEPEDPNAPKKGPGRPTLQLDYGSWDAKAAERFYFDVARRVYRYVKSAMDPDEPGGLSDGFSRQGIAQVITSEYKMTQKAALALVDGLRKMGEQVVDPALPYGIVTRGDLYAYNRYVPGTLAPVAGAWDNLRALFLNLVNGSVEDLEYFLDWLAHPLQQLVLHQRLCKLRTAVVLHGPEGAGKNTIVRLLARCYGERNVVTINQNIISGRFQSIMEHKLFVFANEVRPRDDGSDDRLKELITDRTIVMERKGVEAYETANLANFIFSSNRSRPVHAGGEDRRYTIFHTGPLAAALGALVNADLDGPETEAAAFFDMLLKRPITHDVNTPRINDARASVQSQNLSPAQAFIADVRLLGFSTVGQPWLKQRNDDPSRSLRLSEDSNDVEYNTLFEVYRLWLRQNGFRSGSGRNSDVLKQFRKAGFISEGKRRIVGGVKFTYYTGIPFDPHGLEEDPPVTPPTPAAAELAKPDDLPFGVS